MTSPFPPSTSSPGNGTILITNLPNTHSHLERITYQYPLKLIAPPRQPHPAQSVLVFLLSYGGGLVGGDKVHLDVEIQAGAKLSVVTQGHTKIFCVRDRGLVPARGDGATTATTNGDDDNAVQHTQPDAIKIDRTRSEEVTTRQTLNINIGPGAALCLLPDPVQPFKQSIYEQKQIFTLAGVDSSLCVLDWVTQGRVARGEDWDMTRWVGRNEVWVESGSGTGFGSGTMHVHVPVPTVSSTGDAPPKHKSRLLIRDAVILDTANNNGNMSGHHHQQQHHHHHLKTTMHNLGVFGTLILRGPLLSTLSTFFLDEFAALPRIGARDFRSAADKAAEDDGKSEHEKWRSTRHELERKSQVLWSAARVRGCVVVKFGAPDFEAGKVWVGAMLVREGSVARHFGDSALWCVR